MRAKSRAESAAQAATAAGFDDVIAVVALAESASSFPDGATVLLDESGFGEAGALRAALDWSARSGHDAVVVGLLDGGPARIDPVVEAASWRALARRNRLPIAVVGDPTDRPALLRLEAEVWSVVPHEGPVAALLATKPELVASVVPTPDAAVPAAGASDPAGREPDREWSSEEDVAAVTQLLGRPAAGRFSVVVRDASGAPVVIRNEPLLDDGTPMPTRYWLVGKKERELVGRLESSGGVDRAEAEVDPHALAEAHARYAAERDGALGANPGPRPSGGVGGTRIGVKCLHAHLAWYLAGGADPVGRWVVDQIGSELEGAVAAVDCGTNSTRLLVAAPDGSTLAREMTITRLGANVDGAGRLAPDAIERTVEALRAYRSVMDRFGVVQVRATATSAARDASNAEEFFDRAAAALGCRPELLSGEEEGRLSYLGATAGLERGSGPYLVCDLGGGSTELVAGSPDGGLVAVRSLDVGCVRVTERFLQSDPPAGAEVDAARDHLRSVLAAALADAPGLAEPRAMVGVAGTVSTLVGLKLGLDHYDRDALHHQRLSRSDVVGLTEMLVASPLARRRALPGVERDRADVIVGGALVLCEVMAALGHDSLIYSEDDILDGLVASLRERRATRH